MGKGKGGSLTMAQAQLAVAWQGPLPTLPLQGHGDRIVLADANFPSASVCGEGPEGPRQVAAPLQPSYLR